MSKLLAACHAATRSLALSQLPDELQDYYRQVYEAAPTAETLRWLKSELMQQVWIKLLDDDFIDAYLHGVVVECADGVVRRMFPRFFTYSADYPEKCVPFPYHLYMLMSMQSSPHRYQKSREVPMLPLPCEAAGHLHVAWDGGQGSQAT